MSTRSASDSHSVESSGKIEKDNGVIEKLPPSEYYAASEGLTLEKEAAVSKEDMELERRASLKLDLTLLPVMTMFYLLSFLDRANIGNARVAGLQPALGLTDTEYQICVTILYVPYILAELPSNLLLRRIGPNILMPTILTAWGLVVTFQGFVSSIAYFFSAASLSGAFSGLLAAAIQNMDGLGGKEGWAWIFILEGLFTVLVGVVSFFLVPATPQHASILSQAEKDALKRRLERDRPLISTNDVFKPKEVLRSFLSPHVIILFFVFFLGGTLLYGLALFLPSIVRQLGFGRTESQLLSVGPFAVGFVGQ
ncbi:hypothetical protein H1R20_g6156, partial [Candolleomyces eurysporus]